MIAESDRVILFEPLTKRRLANLEIGLAADEDNPK